MKDVFGQLIDVIKLALILFTIIFGLLILMVSLPQSKLKVFLLPFFKWFFLVTGVIGVLYAISPADLLPDIIPLLGQVDDLGAIIYFVFSGVATVILAIKGKDVISGKPVPEQHLPTIKGLQSGEKKD